MRPRRIDYVAGVLVMVACLVGLRPPDLARADRSAADCRRLIPVTIGGRRATLAEATVLLARSRGERIRSVDARPAEAKRIVRCLARAHGVDPAEAESVVDCETGGTWNVRIVGSGGHLGLWQWDPATWENARGEVAYRGWADAYSASLVAMRSVSGGGWGPWSCAP